MRRSSRTTRLPCFNAFAILARLASTWRAACPAFRRPSATEHCRSEMSLDVGQGECTFLQGFSGIMQGCANVLALQIRERTKNLLVMRGALRFRRKFFDRTRIKAEHYVPALKRIWRQEETPPAALCPRASAYLDTVPTPGVRRAGASTFCAADSTWLAETGPVGTEQLTLLSE
jgi:hypothetical protein